MPRIFLAGLSLFFLSDNLFARQTLTVDFTARPGTSLAQNQLVSFTPTFTPSTATIKSWSWNFGNGTTSTGQNPTISYATPGTYTVSLTATDSTGQSATNTKTGMITVLAAPMEKFTSSATALTAKTYYVDRAVGSDSNSGTSLSAPWKTITKAVATVGIGDTVYVRTGTYSEQLLINTSGTSAQPITFSAYPGESPIINLGGRWPYLGNPNELRGVVTINGNYVVFKGFEVRNGNSVSLPTWASHGIVINGNYAVVQNNTIDLVPNSGISVNSSYNVIDANIVYNTNLKNLNGCMQSNWGSGIAIHGLRTRDATASTPFLIGNIIKNNIVYDNWGEGIHGYYGINGTVITGNTTYDNWSLNIGLSDSVNGVISNNLSYYTGQVPFLKLAGEPSFLENLRSLWMLPTIIKCTITLSMVYP